MPLRPRVVATIAIMVTLALCGATASASVARKPAFRLTSPAFKDGATIPDGFTCTGQSASPPLRWRGVPKGTVDLALVMVDPDAPIGTFVHWVAWGLDPAAGSIPEETIPAGVQEGANGTGNTGYLGPCPPPGSEPHHYRFTLYALDTEVTLPPGASVDELRAAIKGTVLSKARLVGLYAR